MHSIESGRAKSSAPITDLCSFLPILACAFSTLLAPLIYITFPPSPGLAGLMEPRLENRFFWPVMAALSIALAVQNHSRIARISLPVSFICFFAYVAFAGASTVWAFKPVVSFTRYAQELMVITSIVLPVMLADRRADIMQGLFLCFACSAVVNLCFVLGGREDFAQYGEAMVMIGYRGYFTGKNLLGEFATVALLLSLHEMAYPGLRRALGLIIAVLAVSLLLFANSKTALGLAILSPLLAGLTLMIARNARISPAIVVGSLLILWVIFSSISGITTNRISFMLYGDSTFTGRTVIWEFADYEISRRPLAGWGYQSFWLVGSDAPSVIDAPGWVKNMPNAHNGYMDAKLELGYIGLGLLVSFLFANIYVIGRFASRDPRRAWAMLSLTLFIMIYNFLETLWMRAFDMLWVVFLIVAAEIARQAQPATGTACSSPRPRPRGSGFSRGQRRSRNRLPV